MSLSDSEQQQSHRGHITVDHNIFQHIKNAAGSAIDIDDIIDANTGGVKLQTRFINESTLQPHVDRYHHNNEVAVDDVMFVALDSNPDAYFTHGDSSISAVAGRLFRFNGSIKHGTTFNGGNPIRLLGPFSTKNFASVGDPTGVSCPAGGYCLDDPPMVGGGLNTNTVGSFNCPGVRECYELLDGTGVGDCPSGTGVCIFPLGIGSIVGIGDGTSCSEDSNCYVCTNNAGTCPPPTTSTMATTTAAATTTQATTTTTTTSSSSPTFVCNGQCYKYDSVTRALTIDTSSNNVCESDTFCVETADVCPTDTPSSPTVS